MSVRNEKDILTVIWKDYELIIMKQLDIFNIFLFSEINKLLDKSFNIEAKSFNQAVISSSAVRIVILLHILAVSSQSTLFLFNSTSSMIDYSLLS